MSTRITNLADARAVRSRQALQDALLELLKTRSFEQLSVRDIASCANVSHPTFYRQFATKEALLEDVASDEIHRLLSIALPQLGLVNPHDSALTICHYVHERRHLWKTLLTAGAASVMRQEFISAAREVAHSRPRTNPKLPIELAAAFVTSAMFEILAWWLRQPDDYPLESVAEILDELVILPATRLG